MIPSASNPAIVSVPAIILLLLVDKDGNMHIKVPAPNHLVMLLVRMQVFEVVSLETTSSNNCGRQMGIKSHGEVMKRSPVIYKPQR